MMSEVAQNMALGVAVALFFLGAKATLRWVAHRVANVSHDLWLVAAWFGVDLCVASLSVVVAGRLCRESSYLGEVLRVFWMLGLLGGSVVGYAVFLKRRKRCSRKHPAKDRRLALSLTFGLLCGCLALTWTANRLLLTAAHPAKAEVGERAK